MKVGLLEGEQGSAIGFGEQEWPRIDAERGGRIGCRLHEEIDLLASGRAGGQEMLTVIGREPLHRPAVPPHQGLGTESSGAGVPDAEPQRHFPSCPLDRDGASEMEPGGAPGWSPRTADGKRLVIGAECLVSGDRFATNVEGGNVHGDRRPTSVRTDEFGEDPNYPAETDRVLRAHAD
jgi:hypothetical protein